MSIWILSSDMDVHSVNTRRYVFWCSEISINIVIKHVLHVGIISAFSLPEGTYFSVPERTEKNAGLWFARGISTQADTMNSHKVFCSLEIAETLDREIESKKICLAILNFLMHPNMQCKERLLYSKKIYCHRHADCPISSRVLYMVIAVASKKRRICRCCA